MTSETKTFVQAQDIAGIEVECPRCKVTIFYPVSATDKGVEILARCSHCKQELFDAAPVPDSSPYTHFPSHPAIDDLQSIVSGLRSLLRTRTDIHANVRFRIDTEAGTK
jgi:hypothetical protein